MNVVHSMDAYILREMHRRCNHDREVVEDASRLIQIELLNRHMGLEQGSLYIWNKKMAYYIEQYERSTLASTVILPYLTQETVTALSTEHLQALAGILEGMLAHKPFELVTVHDEFRAHANNVNHVRYHYREILAEIADSDVLDDLLSQIHGFPGNFNKLSFNLGDQIRKSEYALC